MPIKLVLIVYSCSVCISRQTQSTHYIQLICLKFLNYFLQQRLLFPSPFFFSSSRAIYSLKSQIMCPIKFPAFWIWFVRYSWRLLTYSSTFFVIWQLDLRVSTELGSFALVRILCALYFSPCIRRYMVSDSSSFRGVKIDQQVQIHLI